MPRRRKPVGGLLQRRSRLRKKFTKACARALAGDGGPITDGTLAESIMKGRRESERAEK